MGSSVSIETRLWDGWAGSQFSARKMGFFSLPLYPDRL